jgi:hypothetical protein
VRPVMPRATAATAASLSAIAPLRSRLVRRESPARWAAPAGERSWAPEASSAASAGMRASSAAASSVIRCGFEDTSSAVRCVHSAAAASASGVRRGHPATERV